MKTIPIGLRYGAASGKSRLKQGSTIAPLSLLSVNGAAVALPRPGKLVHLQFHRFSGCPICGLRLRAYILRYDEILAAGMEAAAVFYSTPAEILQYHAAVPFPLVADPRKELHREFAVGASPMSMLNPAAWPAAVAGILKVGFALPSRNESALGLPADFLIDEDGRLAAVKYGAHADDRWTADEVILLARSRNEGKNR